MCSDNLIFAADSGGSRTRAALLRRDGTPLAVTIKAGVAAAPETLPVAQIIQETVGSLLKKSGKSPQDISCGYFSLGGPNTEETATALELALPGVRIAVDREARGNWFKACAPLLGVDGCVMAGTGTVAIGLSHDDSLVFAGGWGPLYDDLGSGYFIGISTLRKALLMLERREQETGLIEILRRYGDIPPAGDFAGRMNLKSRLMQLNRAEIAGLTPSVYELFLEGDEAATSIIRQAAADIAQLAASIACKPESRILGIGGLFSQADTFLPLCNEAMRTIRPDISILCRPAFSLFKAACIMGLKEAGLTPDFESIEKTNYEEQ
ncbi:MAG: hypothetical protein A2X49_14585 [Lentisphaerae bacterium GWF2_52_8]|nr:MAG: hypothetical protein A2X49_14585 [Lentisphaerae bacterium GWF2_52_8]